MAVSALRALPAWMSLERHHQQIRGLHLRQLFADDTKRGERLAVEAAGIYFDYSKNRITDETIRLLLRLAEQSGLCERIDAVFRGDTSPSRKNAPCCTSRCARPKAYPSCMMARMSCPRSMPSSTR